MTNNAIKSTKAYQDPCQMTKWTKKNWIIFKSCISFSEEDSVMPGEIDVRGKIKKSLFEKMKMVCCSSHI